MQIHNVDELKQRLVDVWSGLQQSVVDTTVKLKPRPHQQQCRSNIVECYNVECCIDNVERCFDIVAQNGNIVASVDRALVSTSGESVCTLQACDRAKGGQFEHLL